MKLPITCNVCKSSQPHTNTYYEELEIKDDHLYELTCPYGHHSVTLLAAQRHEVLFEIGAYAIVDGYYREAISSFTSSLERYYEFFIKTVLTNRSIYSVEIDKSWKNVSSQSERQLGGYIFTYLMAFGTCPSLIANNLVKVRNDVIHKGKIPSKDDAIEYGENVLTHIRTGIAKLRANHDDAIREIIRQNLCEYDTKKYPNVGTMVVPTILNLLVTGNGYHDRSLTEALDEIKEHRLL